MSDATAAIREQALAGTFDGNQVSGADVSSHADGSTVASRMRLLWDARRFLFRMAVSGLLAGAMTALLIPARYQSQTQLMASDTQTGLGLASLMALSEKASGMGLAGDLLGLKTSGAVFIAILRSRTVKDRLVERFGLRRAYGSKNMQDARGKLAANTDISEDRKSGVITLAVTDQSRERATALAQSYVEELDRLMAQLNASAAHRERVFLETRLRAVKEELDTTEKNLSEFSSQHAAIDIKEQARAMLVSAGVLQARLANAQSELEGQRQMYSDGNVQVRASKARVQVLEKKIVQLEDGDLAPSVGKDTTLRPPSLRKLPLVGLTYADLSRRGKIQEKIYELLTQQYELAKVQEAKETPNIKILDNAEIPEGKSFPPRTLISLLAGFLGLVSGTIWTLCRARWNETDPHNPSKRLAQTVYADVAASLGPVTQRSSHVRHITNRVLRFRRHRSSQ